MRSTFRDSIYSKSVRDGCKVRIFVHAMGVGKSCKGCRTYSVEASRKQWISLLVGRGEATGGALERYRGFGRLRLFAVRMIR